jgi:hypothetical protein
MKTIQVDNNEILFLLQSMDLKLSKYAEKNIEDYPEWKAKKILELKKLRDKIGKVAITKLKIGG